MSQALRAAGALTLAASCMVLSACTLPGGTKTPGARITPSSSAPARPATSATPSPSVAATPQASEEAVPPGSPSETPTLEETPTTQPSETAAPPSATPDTPSPSSAPLGSSTTPSPSAHSALVTVPTGTTRALAITDAALATGWVQGAAQPANSSYFIEALSAPVGCNNVSESLEFRFAPTAGTLTLGLAQSADSPSSSETLTWVVTADGRQVATARGTFKETPELNVPLAGVSTVTIQASDPSPCTGTAHALITKAVVAG